MIVLVLQVVAREHGTINDTTWLGGQRKEQATWRVMKMKPMKLRSGSYAKREGTTEPDRKMSYFS